MRVIEEGKGAVMLNRTEVIERLLKIRRSIQTEKGLNEKEIKAELDQLIINIIGDFLNAKDQIQIQQIMEKTFNKEITIEMAMVAIREIVFSYFHDRLDIKKPEKREEITAVHYYKKGYR